MKAPLPCFGRGLLCGRLHLSLLLATLIPTFSQPAVQPQTPDYSTTDAILSADVTSEANDTVAWFNWGTTAAYGNRTPIINVPPSPNPVRISSLLTNLTPYTRYFFQAVASNSAGVTIGDTSNFTRSQLWAVPRFVRVPAPEFNWRAVACSSNGARVIAAAHLLSISTNFGSTWKNSSAPNTNWTAVATSAAGDKLFATAANAASGGIWASYDFGENWQQLTEARPFQRVACSASGSTIVASSDRVFTSRDSGATWQQTSLPAGPWASVTVSADGTKIAASSFSGFFRDAGTIYTSLNSGATWKSTSLQATMLVSAGDGSKLFANAGAFGQSPYASLSTNWGVTWEPTSLYLVGSTAISFDGKKWFIRSGATLDTILCSNDGGASYGFSDQNGLSASAVACSADGGSVYIIAVGGIQAWHQAPPALTMTMEGGEPVLSWPSHRLSGQLEESSNLSANEWAHSQLQPMLTNRHFRVTPSSEATKTFFKLKTP
jgi:hypothetical protein